MTCDDRAEGLSALLDGELPAAQAAELATHLAACPVCTRHLAELAQLRSDLARLIPSEQASPRLQARLDALLAPRQAKNDNVVPFRRTRRMGGGFAIAAAGAVAASLVLNFMPRHDESRDLMSVRDASLRAAALTARPGAAPTIAGFQLVGAHDDVIAGHAARVAQYTRGGEIFTLCSWAADGEPAHGETTSSYEGMHIAYWNKGTTEYWAASTAPSADLQNFTSAALAIL